MENKAIVIAGVDSVSHYSYWRLPTMKIFTGLSKTTIYELMHTDPSFPRPVKIGKATAWRSDEVIAWMDNRPRVEFIGEAA